jgi:hypothetical protein
VVVEAWNHDARASSVLFNGQHRLGRREPHLTHAFSIAQR